MAGRGLLLPHSVAVTSDCRELDVLAPPGRGGALRGLEQLLRLLLLRQGQHGLDARQVDVAAARHHLVRVTVGVGVRVRVGVGVRVRGLGLGLGVGLELGLGSGLGLGSSHRHDGRFDLARQESAPVDAREERVARDVHRAAAPG